MEDVVKTLESKSVKMGASSNANLARIAVLQERKKQIEETLAKQNQELRQLCIQEAELTGITPSEMPLEPGETLPLIRRRVKTAFELPENLVVNSNKDTLISDLELQIQLHANLAEAALGLANEQSISKTVKRQHRAEYQKHKSQVIALQEKLLLLKERAAVELYKQKKKPRTPEQNDTISVNTNFNDPFLKSDIRHSVRSVKQNLPSPNENCVDQRYSHLIPRHTFRNSEVHYTDNQPLRQEEVLSSGFYRLSLNGYNKYMERREKVNSVHQLSNYNTYSNSIPYNLSHSSLQQHTQAHSPHFQQSSPHTSQHSPLMSQHSPHSSQHSPRMTHHTSHMSPQSPRFSQHNPHVSLQHSPQLIQYSPQLAHQRSTMYNHSNYTIDLNKFSLGNNHFSNTQLHRQSSPPIPQKSQYFSSHTIHGQPSYRHCQNENGYRNPHQIQPHQQYEHMGMMTMGLGGCWKKSENGELVWYNSNTIDGNWQKDKRFGSLDRRKNKRIHKRISPSIDPSSGISNYPDQVRNASVKSQIVNRHTQDNGQLVRTQSLGSVGIQTIENVYQSDDNSSCESDNRSVNDINLRKHKEKEWMETSLDGPISPSQLSTTSLQPTSSTVLAPEEKYVVHSPPQPVPSSTASKPPLEIPAESNPSPRLTETNIELFNNNIPKNCTIVQAGVCKPYHEETKPFEMSDFYKYSTKFKKSPVKTESENAVSLSQSSGNVAKNLNEKFEECPQSTYPASAKCPPYNNSNVGNLDNNENLNTSIELGHITVSDHFSAEMNAWYKDQQKNNNNGRNVSKNRSTATLV